MEWKIPKDEMPIIEAALQFGDWLLNHPLCDNQQKEQIVAVQQVLKQLPKHEPGFSGEFGCTIEGIHLDTEGIYRCWGVEFHKDVLEICSVYTPVPEVSLFEQIDHEWTYEIKVGQPALRNFGMDNWAEETRKIESYLTKDYYLEIETGLDGELLFSEKVLLNGEYISQETLFGV